MKRDWLTYLVIFSLALNLGTIGTLVYLRYQDRPPAPPEGMPPPPPEGLPPPPPPLHFQEMWGALNLEEEQRQVMRQMLPEHRRRVMENRRDLARKRQEFFDLIKGPDPQWEAMRAKIREISALQGELEEEMARFLLDIKKHLKPEQHAAFADLVKHRLGRMDRPPGGPPGPPGWGKGMGMGRGPMGPKGPKGPMGPPPPLPPD